MLKSRILSSNRHRPVSDINVVPYIDVMLVLLVIFMITAPLLTQGVQVNMPDAKAKVLPSQEKPPLILSVDKLGHLYLNVSATPTLPMTPEQVAVRVAAELKLGQAENQSRPVLVKADQAVNYGDVVQAMALLQQAGATNIGLMTQPPNDVTG